MKQKGKGKIQFVCMVKIKMLKNIKFLLVTIFTILCFLVLYSFVERDISKYILLLFMQPVLLFFAYKQINKVNILILSLTAILCAFFTFGLNLLYAIIFTIFVVTVLILHSFFKPREIIESPKIQKKNNELKFFKEELINEEAYLRKEKEILEKNLEEITNFYMISKDLIQTFTDSENAANALWNILEKQTGIIRVVITAKNNSQNTKELKILSKINNEEKDKWQKIIKNNTEIEHLKYPTVVNSLFQIDNKSVVAWPIIINNALFACTFLEVEDEYIQYYIEQGNLYIPHLHLGTERILLFLKMKEKSRTDSLTGIYLRRYFLEKLEIEIKRAKRYKTKFHILMLDIDFFKKINDTYGHLVGDKVLIEISNTIQKNIRSIDVLCRYGGEEFIVLINNLSDEEVNGIAQNIREEISKIKFSTNNLSFFVTISIGISKYKESFNSDEIIATADKALYEAKKSGRNKVVSFN